MHHRQQMKIEPLLWQWNNKAPAAGWMDALSKNLPAVYLAGLTEDSSALSELATLLSVEEHARLERFRARDDQRRFLIGRSLLRVLVSAQLQVAASGLQFEYGPSGKPYLLSRTGIPQIHFNVSHSGKLVVLAFHATCEIGVDVEEMRPHTDLEGVAERMFPQEEFQQWKTLAEPARPAAFFRLWARHEARMKALGLGLAGENYSTAKQLEIFDLDLPRGYAGAVACLS